MKKSTKRSRKFPDHYDSLELPVYAWNKVHETGDVSHLLIKKVKMTNAIFTKLIIIWNKIYDEYGKEFGWSETFMQIKEKERELGKLIIQLIKTQDRTLLTEIAIEQDNLKDLRATDTTNDFLKAKIAIENECKFHINVHEISTREFYVRLKNLK